MAVNCSPQFAADDARDAAWCDRERLRVGPSGWLFSLEEQDPAAGPRSRWLCRISCREYPDTLEIHGLTRRLAVERAQAALRGAYHDHGLGSPPC